MKPRVHARILRTALRSAPRGGTPTKEPTSRPEESSTAPTGISATPRRVSSPGSALPREFGETGYSEFAHVDGAGRVTRVAGGSREQVDAGTLEIPLYAQGPSTTPGPVAGYGHDQPRRDQYRHQSHRQVAIQSGPPR